MRFLIEESELLVFWDQPEKEWGVGVVVGVMLSHEARRKFLEEYPQIKKHMRQNQAFVETLVDDLIRWDVHAFLITADHVNVLKNDAERFRHGFLAPLYQHAQTLSSSPSLQESVCSHLDNLAGKGKHEFHIQDFAKICLILETITALLQMYTCQLATIRSVDVRKISLIIDTQTDAAWMTLKEGFVHFFLNCRSQEKIFSVPPKCSEFRKLYTQKEMNITYLNSCKLFPKIQVDKNESMDEEILELHIADILANLASRLFKGKVGRGLANKLLKIFKFGEHIHFNPDRVCFDIPIPEVPNKEVIKDFLSRLPSLNKRQVSC